MVGGGGGGGGGGGVASLGGGRWGTAPKTWDSKYSFK